MNSEDNQKGVAAQPNAIAQPSRRRTGCAVSGWRNNHEANTVHIFVHPPMDKRKDAQNAPDTQKAFIKAPPRCRQASAP